MTFYRFYSANEANAWINAHGRYDHDYKIVEKGDRAFAVQGTDRFTNVTALLTVESASGAPVK